MVSIVRNAQIVLFIAALIAITAVDTARTASVYKEIVINARPEYVWAVVRDYEAPQKLAPGFLLESRVEGDARIVTFQDGRVAREVLVDIDDARRRLVYAEPGGRFITRNASMQVFAEGDDRCRLVWINDVLPSEFATLIGTNMDKALAIIKQTMELGAAHTYP
jgi:carbon monoxide dehydrogenase subunit G